MKGCCRRYTKMGSRLHSRPGDFVVELDDAIVHGEVLDNVLLLVDLLLGVQEVVLLIPCNLSSFGSLVFSSGFAYLLQNFTCFFIGQTKPSTLAPRGCGVGNGLPSE